MTKKFLHIGCGSKTKEQTTPAFNTEEWEEVRLDIDETVNPDIIATITDMTCVNDKSFDAVYSSHNIEHVFAHEVSKVFNEVYRILVDDGFFIVTCPDLQTVSKFIAEDKLTDSLYNSPAGPITPLDILYGHRASIANGQHYMAHKVGFTAKVLFGELNKAQFTSSLVGRIEDKFSLWGVATKVQTSDDDLEIMLKNHFNGS